jgi:type I restriction enzyme M protein
MLQLLPLLGFSSIDRNLWSKKYAGHSDYEIGVVISDERIEYGPDITLGDQTTANLSHSENLVVLECVNRLLIKGYRPKDLTLEKKWSLGRTAKGGKADVIVNDLEGKALFIVECKNWGSEYEKEKSRMQSVSQHA